jgi:hypothetical protein
MTGTVPRALLVAAALAVVSNLLLADSAVAQGRYVATAPRASQPDLFYNFYVGPSAQGGVPAELYLCPRPTPPLVGHTYITYQPMMPHEYMYPHRRTYWRYHPGSGMTRTKVLWTW